MVPGWRLQAKQTNASTIVKPGAFRSLAGRETLPVFRCKTCSNRDPRLRQVLTLYSIYYNKMRTHLGLGQGRAAATSRRTIWNRRRHTNPFRIASSIRPDMIFGKDWHIFGFIPGIGYAYYWYYDDCYVLTDYGWINICSYEYRSGRPSPHIRVIRTPGTTAFSRTFLFRC